MQHETIARPAAHAGRHHTRPIARSIPSQMLAKRLQIAEARGDRTQMLVEYGTHTVSILDHHLTRNVFASATVTSALTIQRPHTLAMPQ